MRQERFTEQAQEAIVASQQLMMQLRHIQWDVEHILMALLLQEKGLVGEILRDLGADVDGVKQQVGAVLEKSPRLAYETQQTYQIQPTPRVIQLFQTAEAEANRLKDEFIGTEHLLIAISSEDKGQAANILKTLRY